MKRFILGSLAVMCFLLFIVYAINYIVTIKGIEWHFFIGAIYWLFIFTYMVILPLYSLIIGLTCAVKLLFERPLISRNLYVIGLLSSMLAFAYSASSYVKGRI